MKLDNSLAVVTGAGSGIGRGIALALARRGCHLVLADIAQEGLSQTAREVREIGVRANCYRLDVADRNAVRELAQTVEREHGGAQLLVNNAGVALGGTFEQVSEEDFDWLMNINFHGVVSMTRAFLPQLKRGGEARIVNISSLYGIVAPPGQAAYSASKFAVRGFSNVLRHELAGSNVGVTVVHPGGVATSIAQSARAPAGVAEQEVRRHRAIAQKLLRMAPEKAGEIIVRGIERRKARVLVGLDAVIVALLERLMPVAYWNLLKKGIRT
jgi:short-subunit dehydrogenase